MSVTFWLLSSPQSAPGRSPEYFTVTGILLFIPVSSLDSQITFPQRFTVLKRLGKGLIPLLMFSAQLES